MRKETEDIGLSGLPKTRGFASVGLLNPKSPDNVGSVLRAAQVYGAKMVALQGNRYSNWPTDTMKGWRTAPFIHTLDLRSVIPYGCRPIAVDLVRGAKSLVTYHHPEQAFYIFGPEDGTLGPNILSWCVDIIYVPTAFCMNLAACVNVVLYDRLAKGIKDTPGLPA